MAVKKKAPEISSEEDEEDEDESAAADKTEAAVQKPATAAAAGEVAKPPPAEAEDSEGFQSPATPSEDEDEWKGGSMYVVYVTYVMTYFQYLI